VTETISQSSLHAAMQALHKRSDALLTPLSPAQLDALQATPLWSASDVLRHLLAWNELTAAALKVWPSDHSAVLPVFNTLDEINAYLLDRYRHLSPSETIERNYAAHKAMLEQIDAASAQELVQINTPPGWHSSTSMLGFVDEMIKHDHEHLDQIEAALSR
jgi:hypothetical protein